MNNPFENEKGAYAVLINGEGQYSIWPAFLDVPSGWTVIYGEESRQLCLDYINSRWTDMRPNSLKPQVQEQ
ncbi:MAG: MbtH domain protein [Firmicutes bacterium]|jgi:MbtH protein|nr:MbtH domain protein [Bacillota bacterium]